MCLSRETVKKQKTKKNNNNLSLLPRRALTLKKAVTPTVETQVQLCAANVGVEGKAAFCLGHLHKV